MVVNTPGHCIGPNNCLPAEGRQAIGFDIPPGYTHEKEKTIQIRLVLVVLVLVVTNFLNSILRQISVLTIPK